MARFGTVRKDWNWVRTPLAPAALKGHKAAVIGGTNGIGRALAQALAREGAEVLVIGRTFRDQATRGLTFVQADLSSMKEASRLAQALPAETLDLLLLTQGIFAGPARQQTAEGLERDMAVSALSRLVLVRELAGRLGKARPPGKPKPRIFVWGFPGQDRKATVDDFNSEAQYRWPVAHGNGVVVNEALVLDSAERYPGLNVYGMNPGIISSNIMAGVLGEGSLALRLQQTVMGIIFQSAEVYARKMLPLLVSPDLEDRSGAMFNRHGLPIYSNPSLADKSYLQRVMGESEKLVRKALG